MELTKEAVMRCRHVGALREFLCQAMDQIDAKDKEIARHKCKRCLAMAEKWRNYAAFCGQQSSCHNHRGFGKTAEKYTWKECHAWKCVKRWLAIAEKFKEAK